ncbi:MAG: hypothetical protein K1X74_23340, partial [Pirellulales bacterium]|nr:hypothetical protein [Pirellulales bacterium]
TGNAILPRSTDSSSFLAADGTNASVIGLTANGYFDAWESPHPYAQLDPETGCLLAYTEPLGSTLGDSTRPNDDIVLTNVLGFDIKAWDPDAPVLERELTTGEWVTLLPGDAEYTRELGNALTGVASAGVSSVPRVARFGAYVDLNFLCGLGNNGLTTTPYGSDPNSINLHGLTMPIFGGPGLTRSQQSGTPPAVAPAVAPAWADIRASVYDTWSTHYESDGQDQDGDGAIDEFTDGFDNDVQTPGTPPTYPEINASTAISDGFGGIDDLTEMEAPPPYPVPLRGIQIKLRVFEPDTKQIREVTIVQDFVTR